MIIGKLNKERGVGKRLCYHALKFNNVVFGQFNSSKLLSLCQTRQEPCKSLHPQKRHSAVSRNKRFKMCRAFSFRMVKKSRTAVRNERVQTSFLIRFCGDDSKNSAARPPGTGSDNAADSVAFTECVFTDFQFSLSIKAHIFVRISGPFSVIKMEFS